MCGIAGIIGATFPGAAQRMVAAMHHRGPDDSGVFFADGCALAHARLSIIDLSCCAHQPMTNTEGSLAIVYNGETYNFQEERVLLEAKGRCFSSRSDTEVVLAMYEEYGDDFLLRLRGMFALAIYDRRRGPGKERLLLARDHLGIKPLLYAETSGRLVFASEMKALLASGLIERQIDPEAVRLLLTFGSVMQPRTIVAGVNMLRPAHRLIYEDDKSRLERYWHLSDKRHPAVRNLPYQEQVALIRDALTDSVRAQMISDVPVGAFLSGGIDSSVLVALMARQTSQKIRTYSVGFGREGGALDETDAARRIAAFIGTEHSRIVVTGQDMADSIQAIAAALDQPSVDGVNSWFVSRAARQGVTVALSGTGGDESFGGYPWFITMVLAAQQFRNPTLLQSAKQTAGSIVQKSCFDGLVRTRFGGRLEHLRGTGSFLARYARTYNIFGASRGARMMAGALRLLAAVGREMALDLADADELADAQPLERVSALCLRGYLQNQLLRDIDAVSMHHSLEVRVPYLDVPLIDLALSLPQTSKLSDLSGLPRPEAASYRATGTKKILVDLGRELLPPGMDEQSKRGFAMPFDVWMRGALREVLNDALADRTIRHRGLFDPEQVQLLRRDFDDGRVGWQQPWLLMMVELWCRGVLDRS